MADHRWWCVTALVLALSVGALAQPATPDASSTTTVNLTLDQRHVIRELSRDLKLEPAPADLKIAPGEIVPPVIAVHPMPDSIASKVPQVRAHRFFLSGGRFVLVDAQERTVVAIIE